MTRLSRPAVAAALAAACSAFFLPLVNPDLFWHLSAGRRLFETGAVPRADWLSWTAAGAPWTDFEWGAQAVYYLLWKAGGWPALFFFKAALLCGALLVFRRLLLLYGRPGALPLALPLLAAGLVSSADIRPENFSLLFFAWSLYRLEKIRLQGPPPPGHYGGALLLSALWANFHAGVFYGLALAGLYAAGELVGRYAPAPAAAGGAQGAGRAPLWRAYAGLFAAGLAGVLLNPYGWKIYAVAAEHAALGPVLAEYLQEWAPPSFANPYQWPFFLALAGGAAALPTALLRRGHLAWPHLLCFGFFAWGGAAHGRHIPYFMLAGLAGLFAVPLRPAIPAAARRALWALWAAACLWFWAAQVRPHYAWPPEAFVSRSPGLARFLRGEKETLSTLKMYNWWGWGGWLGWALAPDYKVFADGRYLFHALLPEMVEARRSASAWRDYIARYGFELLLIKLDEPPVPVRQFSGGRLRVFHRPAYLFYLPKKDWAVLYWDAKIAAVARRDRLGPAWLEGREYRWLRPGDLGSLRGPVLAGEVRLSELEAEARLYAAQHGAPLLDGFVAELRAACAGKEARCRD